MKRIKLWRLRLIRLYERWKLTNKISVIMVINRHHCSECDCITVHREVFVIGIVAISDGRTIFGCPNGLKCSYCGAVAFVITVHPEGSKTKNEIDMAYDYLVMSNLAEPSEE